MRFLLLLVVSVACAPTVGQAVDTDAPGAQLAAEPSSRPESNGAPAGRCQGEAHRAFDFWLGEWEVRNPAGKVAGHNRIEAIHGGCALREEWTGAGPSRGTSLNIYDASRGVWHQTWVDNAGTLLLLEGGLEGERMVLRGPGRKGGKELIHEIAWTPLPDGRVEQHWRASPDGGQSWNDVFVGSYERAAPR